ncbi:MAG: ABC transporter permease [Halothiobacillaceae bacterium]|nr:ABC transporter permease [Halothiobacillaceae bacterium]
MSPQDPLPKANSKTAQPKYGVLCAWQAHHGRCFKDALWRLVRKPVSAWATIVAIAVVLALPGFIMTLAGQIKHIGGAWASEQGQINIYLHTQATPNEIQAFKTWLNAQAQVKSSQEITPQAGLKELAQQLQIQQITTLDPNPLPTVFLIHLHDPSGQATLALRQALSNNPLVANLSEGGAWIKRLQEISQFFDQISWWTLGLFGLTVIFVVGNTLRLELQERREELALIGLIGGTRRYMLRPLLYDGAITGLLGGIVASVLVFALITALAAPINQFAAGYGTRITVFPPLLLSLLFGGIGLALGWLSAQIIGQNFLRKSGSA